MYQASRRHNAIGNAPQKPRAGRGAARHTPALPRCPGARCRRSCPTRRQSHGGQHVDARAMLTTREYVLTPAEPMAFARARRLSNLFLNAACAASHPRGFQGPGNLRKISPDLFTRDAWLGMQRCAPSSSFFLVLVELVCNPVCLHPMRGTCLHARLARHAAVRCFVELCCNP
jgi:hypothetical protein